jgi:microsomal dipeptidase-like Zn-dependent dipeptidase
LSINFDEIIPHRFSTLIREELEALKVFLQVIIDMKVVEMIVDVSRIGYRASMEAFETSNARVIFSHSNPRGVRDHVRKITDEQIKACARTGCVVGINGGLFSR